MRRIRVGWRRSSRLEPVGSSGRTVRPTSGLSAEIFAKLNDSERTKSERSGSDLAADRPANSSLLHHLSQQVVRSDRAARRLDGMKSDERPLSIVPAARRATCWPPEGPLPLPAAPGAESRAPSRQLAAGRVEHVREFQFAGADAIIGRARRRWAPLPEMMQQAANERAPPEAGTMAGEEVAQQVSRWPIHREAD